MKMPGTRHGFIFGALLALAGCAGDPGAPLGSAGPSEPPDTCERVCNTEFDTCTSRFAGIGNSVGSSDRSGEMSTALGANDVCPDQLKSCLRRCLN